MTCLGRLAVPVPRPRINLLLYQGVPGGAVGVAGRGRAAGPRAGGRLRLITLIEQTAVIIRILRHLGLPSEVPARGVEHRMCNSPSSGVGIGLG